MKGRSDVNQKEKIKERLISLKTKRILSEDLVNYTGFESYTEAALFIQQLEKEGVISRIPRSGTNGRVPALYQRYNILITASEETNELSKEMISKELIGLHPKIKTDHYARYTKAYLQHRETILKLSQFLKRCDREEVAEVALNERSFELFKNEKHLQELISSGKSNPLEPLKKSNFLNNLGLTLNDLRVYESNESFFYVLSRTITSPCSILIVENKDTYVTLQKLLIQSGRLSLASQEKPIQGIIYGEGFKIIDSLRTALTHPEPIFCHPETDYLYLGDLDYAGLLIYLKLKEVYQDVFNLTYLPHYFDWLIQCFEAKFPNEAWPSLTDKKSNQQPLLFETYQSLLSKSNASVIREQLESNHYLPQETMSREDWIKVLKEVKE